MSKPKIVPTLITIPFFANWTMYNNNGGYCWREYAAQHFSWLGLATRSPMRDKSFLKGQTIRSENAVSYASPYATSRAIMIRDTNDVLTSDAVLVNFEGVTDEISIGTVMEMTLAWHARIPVIVIGNTAKLLQHPMLNQTVDFRTASLDEGIVVTASVLGVSK